MRIFLDTSVLVAAVVANHNAHPQAFPILQRVLEGKDQGLVAAHSLAEMYAILTKLPPPFRHSPEQALLSIEANVLAHFQLLHLTGGEYGALIREAAVAGIQGGTIYDALLLATAAKARADRIYTLNLKHFLAVVPGSLAAKLAAP
jgi:predicted nucleic acid-binding protein